MEEREDRDFIFYLCRHTCGSRLVQRTGNIALTKKWLGHKRIEQTLRYAHLNSNSLLSGLKALEYGTLCGDNKVTNLSAFTDKTNNYKKELKQAKSLMLYRIQVKCGCGGTGRHARFRFSTFFLSSLNPLLRNALSPLNNKKTSLIKFIAN